MCEREFSIELLKESAGIACPAVLLLSVLTRISPFLDWYLTLLLCTIVTFHPAVLGQWLLLCGHLWLSSVSTLVTPVSLSLCVADIVEDLGQRRML